MRIEKILPIVLMIHQIIVGSQQVHDRVTFYKSLEERSSFMKSAIPREHSYYKMFFYDCTKDDATYLFVKGLTEKNVISDMVLACKHEQEALGFGQKIVQKKGHMYCDGAEAIVDFMILYGFNNEQEAWDYQGIKG